MKMLKNVQVMVNIILAGVLGLSSIAFVHAQHPSRMELEGQRTDVSEAEETFAVQMQFLDLPDEMIMQLLLYLPHRDILNLRETCMKLRAIIDDTLSRLSFSFLSLEKRDALATKDLLVILRRFPNLKEIDLAGCSQVTDVLLLWIARKYQFLVKLEFAFISLDPFDESVISQVTDIALQALAERCHQLTTLNLYGCSQITDAGLQSLAKGCHQLTKINLSYCDQITDVGLQALGKKCPRLTKINLSCCSKVSDAALQTLAERCPRLTTLNLTWCDKITDAGLQGLAAGCSQLIQLNLYNCHQITDAGVQALVAGCPHLRSLNIRCCSGVTEAMVQELRQQYPQLTITR